MILTECQVAIHAGLREYPSKSKRAINLRVESQDLDSYSVHCQLGLNPI